MLFKSRFVALADLSSIPNASSDTTATGDRNKTHHFPFPYFSEFGKIWDHFSTQKKKKKKIMEV